MADTIWPWVGFAAMVLGTVPPLWQAVGDDERREFYGVLAGIVGIAALAYLGIALGIGEYIVRGREFQALRYVDWLVTTPLIVLYLAMLAKPGKRTYWELVVVDALVIITGAAAIVLPSPIRFASYAVGALLYVYLAYLLVVRVPRECTIDSVQRRALFAKLRNLTIVLWAIYPVVWLVSMKGFGLLLPQTEQIVTIYLDTLAKVGFVIVAVNGSDTIDVDLDADSVGGLVGGD